MKQDDVVKRFFNTRSGEKWEYSEEQCFLCLTALTDENATVEHVIPKWMLTRHDLWNESMTLLNGTRMRYRQLTIPCCQPCNNNYLSDVEDRVSEAFKDGHAAVDALDRKLLFMWLAKVFYGLLVRERYALLSQRDQNGAKILDDSDLDRFAMHHLLMQSVRGESVWAGDRNPWSIYVLKCQTSEEPKLNFDYIDCFQVPCLSIRSGEVAIVAALQDWGYMETELEFNHMVAAQQLELHPLQFKEVAVYFNMLSIAFFKEQHLMLAHGGDNTTVIRPPQALGLSEPLFKPDLLAAAPALAKHFGIPIDHITDGRKVVGTLIGYDGSPYVMHWAGEEDYPVPTIKPVDENGQLVELAE